MSFSRVARRNRIAGSVMLAAFVLWQCGAMLHLVFDTHVILPDGCVADLDHRTGEPIRESSGDDPTDNGCPILIQLTAVSAMASQDVVAVVLEDVQEQLVEPKKEIHVVTEDELFLIAPSHSPPTHS